MTIVAHPSPRMLAGYAIGRLAIAAGVTVDAHLATCAACQLQVRVFEEAEGQRLEAEEDAPLAPGALSQVLERIDGLADEPQIEPQAPALADIPVPREAARLGLGSRRWLAAGLWAAPVRVPTREGWRAFLLRAPAGTRIPTHRHEGRELIAVLSGAFHDSRGYAAGDFVDNRRDQEHDLTIFDEGPCACLIAIEGRVHWRGWLDVIGKMLGI